VRGGILTTLLAATCALANDYLGQAPPGQIPVVFARGTVSSDDLEHNAPAFSPDGNEVFWCVTPGAKGSPKVIKTMRREGGVWSAPAVAPFSGEFGDCEPVFSADGRRIYFDSERPTPSGIKGDGPWFVEKQESRWSEPKCLGIVARFPELRFALMPAIARNGALYFVAYAAGPLNDFGIYRAELVNGEYVKPQLLPRSINLPPFLNWTPYVAPDESYLLFSSNRRSPDTDAGDLFLSRRQTDGGWSDPVSLGEPVNSDRQERFPAISPEGKYLFFTRPTPGHSQDVYWVRAESLVPPVLAPSEVSFSETGQQLNRLAGRGVALADFNGDGCLDAFVVNQNTPDGQGHRVYFGDCRGRFIDSGQVLANASGFGGKPAIGDVNGDGRLDVITGRTVWLNDGKGHFAAHPELIPGSEELDLVRLADLDGDGNLDLVAVTGWRNVRVYLGDGKGHFRDTGQRFGSGIIGSIALGDVDGDGTIDLVTGGWRNSGGDPCPNRVWLNDGKGNFRDSGQVFDEGDTHVHGMALGDVDGDGHPDIVLAMTTPGRAGKIYLNDGKGHFHDSGQIIGHQWAHSVALGDLNGDGHLDIFLACGEPHPGTPNEVWLNDGKGRFRDSGLRLGNAFSWDVALGDLNGDGRLDAFVANLRVADDSKNPPVFGGVAAEVWLNTTASTDYLGQAPPGETPVVFAPGVVSDGHIHSRLAISPDGNQMCWTSVPTLTGQGVPRIVCVARENGTWTKPQTPPFAAEGMTANPLFSPDGAKLFFDFAESREKGWRTRYVEKTGSGWSTPRSDGVLLRTSSSFTKSGKVYYSDRLSGKPWDTGIYSARHSAAGYSDAQALDAAFNSPYIDYTPYISPDEAYLMFSSSRPSADERMFLHISFRNSDGTWSPPRKLGGPMGFAGAARFPSISPDGKYLFFCGDDGNFYWADIKVIEKLKPAQESDYLKLQGAVLGEVIQHDAMMLNFHVPMYVDRLKQAGKAIPDQVNELLAAARAANDRQDYYRAFRLYARAAGLASAEDKVEQYEVAAAFRTFLNRAIFASGENVTLAVRPLFTLGHPLSNRYTAHVWLETEAGAVAGSDRALTVSELKEYDFDYPADGLRDGVIGVGYRLSSPAGETLAELKQAVVVAKDVRHRLERLKEKFAAAKQKGGAALGTVEYDIRSLERERESFDGNWQRAAHPFGMYLGRVNFIALGRPDGNTFPQFNARLRYPEDVAFAESLIDGLATDPDTLLKRSGDMAEAYRSAVDGQLLRYRIYVPRGYDRSKKYSLIVALHSGGGDSTYFEWEEHFTPPGQHPENRFKQLAEERGYIVVCPNGSSGTSLGERDDPEVVALIEKVREMYSVEPKRVFLTGWSVGASAAWRIAVSHPELFGAVALVGGQADWLNRQNTEKARDLPIQYSLTTSEVEQAKSTTEPAKEFLPKFSQKEYPGTDHVTVWAKALPDVFDFFDARTPLVVTYIANEGFMIQGGGKKVLIDALVASIPPATEQTLKAITEGRDPFNDVDLILATHQHADHFDPASLIACLRSNPKARLIAPAQAVDLMRSIDGFAGIEKQIQEIKGEPGAREQVSHNEIAVDVLCLNHEHLPQVRNLAFAVELGGARFLHMGDAFIGGVLSVSLRN
jgi:dipeptidyl aminopeptidase/acylaminoacyl peptidase